jgi:hypothetical protein
VCEVCGMESLVDCSNVKICDIMEGKCDNKEEYSN